jgi:pimeloyl-ACP methyl ester carboxylesterase
LAIAVHRLREVYLSGFGESDGTRAGEVRLADGRVLAYAEWGPPDGRPLIHFHGIPDGRFSWGAGSACEDRDIRLIAVDRPGVGGSDPKPGRSVVDWASDVEELAERLEVERFSVSGLSAGGPYALACAHEFGDRIECVALISTAGRLDVPGFVGQMHTARAWWLAAHLPRAMAFLYSTGGRLARGSPTVALKLIAANFPKVDREVLNRPDISPRLLSAYVEATRAGGGRGLAEDMRVMLSPWGFDPAEIGVPVYVFHGRRDAVAPPAHAEHWIESLADARPVWFEDAGHLGVAEDHAGEILDGVAARGQPVEGLGGQAD